MKYIKLIFLLLLTKVVLADEGMWLPQLLEQMNEKQMKALGMKINASDIYNINKGSLKDAVVSFGGFCTGEVISDKGLVITNHHCGFDAIQNHSTVEHNYLKDGYWARSMGEEFPNAGLFVTFIVRIDDVSKQVLNGVTPSLSEGQRQSIIDKNINQLKSTIKKESYQDVLVRSFYEGNKYYSFVTETYRDIRLVGAPPSSIGNFGKDTDNWVWPRHTGDFSMFRIYAGKDNKPAAYSPSNVPYKPKKSLSISLDGMKEGDFTMVFGFPGRTYEYLPSSAVEQIIDVNDPVKIGIREKALSVIDAAMRGSEAVRLQYAAKYANIENAYKKWQGEILGMQRTKGLEKKRAYEAEFQKRVNANLQWKQQYGNLLPDLAAAYASFKQLGYGRDYYTEVMNRIELFNIAGEFNWLAGVKDKSSEKTFLDSVKLAKQELQDIYKEYNPVVDKQLFASLMQMFVTNQDKSMLSPALLQLLDKANGNYTRMADLLYDETEIDNENKTLQELDKEPAEYVEKYKRENVPTLLTSMRSVYSTNIASKLPVSLARLNELQRDYMKAQMEVFKEKKFYPDANSTLRVAYGKVNGYDPRNAVHYSAFTFLDGVMEKYKPGDYEFDLPQKLRDLYKAKDYGQYGSNGKMPVCFIATNHTTGGNSGSPVIDAYGNLIGINFDRAWEGTMSDYNYDPSICRNIMVDIRYVLFIIDKYAGASNLIKEMKLVHPRTRAKQKV